MSGKASLKEKGRGATPNYFPATTSNCDAIVGVTTIGNLRVLLTQEDGAWFAQGLEIDYFAQGESLNDVQTRFENGLSCTVNEHIKTYGNIDKLVVQAPQEVWLELMQLKSKAFTHSQVTFHEVFEGITYYQKAA